MARFAVHLQAGAPSMRSVSRGVWHVQGGLQRVATVSLPGEHVGPSCGRGWRRIVEMFGSSEAHRRGGHGGVLESASAFWFAVGV